MLADLIYNSRTSSRIRERSVALIVLVSVSFFKDFQKQSKFYPEFRISAVFTRKSEISDKESKRR